MQRPTIYVIGFWGTRLKMDLHNLRSPIAKSAGVGKYYTLCNEPAK